MEFSAKKESLFSRRPDPAGWWCGGQNRVRRSGMECRLLAKGHFRKLHAPTPASLRDGTLGAWENSPALARRWNSSIASWVRYCRPAMLMVLSQPFFRQRQAVHGVTPTCSSHRDRLTTAGPEFGYVLRFDSTFTRHNLPRARRTRVYQKHEVTRSKFFVPDTSNGTPLGCRL